MAHIKNIEEGTTWLNLNYNVQGLTEEQRQFNINKHIANSLERFTKYPIMMVNGDFQEQPSIVSSGVFYCGGA